MKHIEIIKWPTVSDIQFDVFKFNVGKNQWFHLYEEEVAFILAHIDLLKKNYNKYKQGGGGANQNKD